MGGGGLYGCFRKEDLPVGVQDYREEFHRGCINSEIPSLGVDCGRASVRTC